MNSTGDKSDIISNSAINTENQALVGNALIEFITVTIKYRWFLFWFIFVITSVAILVALISPKWYKSRASVFPAEEADLLGELGGLSSLVKTFSPGKGLSGLTGPSETDRYIAILKSGSVVDKVINKFDLVNVYEISDGSIEKTAKVLMSNVDIEVQDEGNLTIDVYDKDPQRAADMANYFVEILNEVNSRLHVQNATANREFIEKRYNQNLKDIAEGEQTMQDFQKKYGVVAVPEQIEATVKAMAEVYGKLAEKEIEFNVLKRSLSIEHPVLKTTEIEVQELRKKIDLINTGSKNLNSDIKVLIPFKQAPELGAEYLKIYRNLEIQYKILQFITPLYEQSRVEEIRNTPSVIILDRASPAERKAKPKISLYALIAFISSVLVGFVVVYTKELTDRLQKASPQKYNYITNALKSDWSKLPFRKKSNH